MRLIMVLAVGVIITGTGLAGCSTNRDDGFGDQLESKADELVGNEETAYPTFFFPQPPIELDAAGPTPEQFEHLADADVPMGTHFFVSGQLLNESGSSTGVLEITDMMRGPEASSQSFSFSLVDVDGLNEVSVSQTAGGLCEQPGFLPEEIRGLSGGCANLEQRLVVWEQDDVAFVASMHVAASMEDLLEWVEALEHVELGANGPPYEGTFCNDLPGRCP